MLSKKRIYILIAYLIAAYLSYHLFSTIINVSYKYRANKNYSEDIKNISQFYNSILKNNSDDSILELLPAIEQRIIKISPHKLAILINYNPLLEPLSQTSVLVSDASLNEHLIKNLENLIRKKLKKNSANIVLNIASDMLLFTIYYPENQTLRYTVLGYQDPSFFKSYKRILTTFYILYFLIHFLTILGLLWFWKFNKKRFGLFKFIKPKTKTKSLKKIKPKSPTFSTDASKENQVKEGSILKDDFSQNDILPEKVKYVHSSIRPLEKILSFKNIDVKKIANAFIEIFSINLSHQSKENIITPVLNQMFDPQAKYICKIYLHDKNNPHSYQLEYYRDSKSEQKNIHEITENTIDAPMLKEGKQLLNGYPIFIEEETYYRYIFPLLVSDKKANSELLKEESLKNEKTVVSLVEIITHQSISQEKYKETFSLSLILLEAIEGQKETRQYEKTNISYLQKWLEIHYHHIVKVKLSAWLIAIKLPSQEGNFDTQSFLYFIENIKDNFRLNNNQITFFYDMELEAFLGLIIGTGGKEMSDLKNKIIQEIDIKFNYQSDEKSLSPISVVENIGKKNKVVIYPLANNEFKNLGENILTKIQEG